MDELLADMLVPLLSDEVIEERIRDIMDDLRDMAPWELKVLRWMGAMDGTHPNVGSLIAEACRRLLEGEG